MRDMTFRAITLRIVADFDDEKNFYDSAFSEFRHFGESLESGRITPGAGVHVEFGTGDVITEAAVVSVTMVDSHVVAHGHVTDQRGDLRAAEQHDSGVTTYLPYLDDRHRVADPEIADTFVASTAGTKGD